ncbi:MAG: hypothetical protein J6R83_04490 [Clostridia bacterium]|nr:hypothetical protein [Clostridia bacterium]
MKISIMGLIKGLLNKWLVILLALIVGVGAGVFVNSYKASQIEYVAMVYIDQNFDEKNPEPGVNYPNTVESLTARLMDNSLLAMNNAGYMSEICTANGLDVSKLELTNYIEFTKESSNVIKITVKFANEQLSKSICEDIIETLPKHLNNLILHNIDTQTGDFVAGTLENNKIYVTEFMQPTKREVQDNNEILTIGICAVGVTFVAVLTILVINLIKNKVNKASSVRSSVNVAVSDAKSFAEGVELCVANALAKNSNDRTFAFCCGELSNQDIEKACETLAKNKKVVALVVSCDQQLAFDKKLDNLTLSTLSGDVLKRIETVNSVKQGDSDVNLIIIKNSFSQEQATLYCEVADSTFIILKNNVDSLWGLHELVGKLNDNEIKIDRIICA